MPKTFKVGDIVIVYRKYKYMYSGWMSDMDRYIGNMYRIVNVVKSSPYTYDLEDLNGKNNKWCWNVSVLRRATRDEIIMEAL